MLESITLSNFKAARQLSVRLGSLTLLAGLNGSGKSTLLQSLAVLRQSMALSEAQPRLHLRGNLVQLGKARDVLNWNASRDQIEIALSTKSGPIDFTADATDRLADVLSLSGDLERLRDTNLGRPGAFQFIQADRIVPRTYYEQADASQRNERWLGTHGEFTVDFLSLNSSEKVSSMRTWSRESPGLDSESIAVIAPTDQLLDQVAGWLQHLSPGVSLVAHPVDLSDLAMLAFRYDTKGVAGRSDDSRPTNVGFGLTYCLPIVVACLASRPHSLILLENPEAHLHPRGQVALGTLLAKCAADNVQVVCETHSDHLLNGVRLAVKQKIVEPQKVRMHYFERALDTGECFVQSPEILASGELTNWPSGFFDQWQQSLDELLD